METRRRRQPERVVSIKAPKFFKIITVPDANMLRIPDEFMRRYGQNLPNSVFLQAPDGPSLKVEVIHSNGETWLDKGWQRFRDYHSLTVGNFLLFDYDRTSGFNVLIFDTSNTEIEYLVATVADQRQVQEPEKVELESDDDSVIFKEEILSRKKSIDKGKQKNSEKMDREEKKMLSRTDDHRGKKVAMSASAMRSEKHDSGTKDVSLNCHSESIQRNKRDLGKSTSSFRKLKRDVKDHVSTNEYLVETEDSETEESDSEFDNSSCLKFEIVVKDYSRQAVCMDFAETAGLVTKKSVTLQYPPKQRCWSVLLEQRPYTASSRLYITAGWSNFCKENLFNIGETYSLEFNVAKNVIQVQRVDKNSNYEAEDDNKRQKRMRHEVRKHSSKMNNCTKETRTVDKETSIAYRMAEAFKNNNTIPHLSVVSFMSASYISDFRLFIRKSIVRDNLHKEKNSIQLCLSSEKMWPAQCGYKGRNGYIGVGWNSFRDENGLKLGDACVFELDKNNKWLWNVTIFRN